jgi:small GTP-binding protein
MDENVKLQKKVILLGDGEVGKTSLIRRFVLDKYDDKYILTVGTKITAKNIQIGKDSRLFELHLQVWDILGQKGYTKLHNSSFRGTDGVFLVADLTKKATLLSLGKYWIPKVQNLVGDVPLIVLANKSDLIKQAEFSEKILKSFAQIYDAKYYFTSAKTGENVHQAFYGMGKQLILEKDEMKLHTHKTKILHPSLLADDNKIGTVKLIDKIIDDFCQEYGNYEEAMPILRAQFMNAGVDLKNPTQDSLKNVIQRLAHIEMERKSIEVAEANAVKRLKWISEFSDKLS